MKLPSARCHTWGIQPTWKMWLFLNLLRFSRAKNQKWVTTGVLKQAQESFLMEARPLASSFKHMRSFCLHFISEPQQTDPDVWIKHQDRVYTWWWQSLLHQPLLVKLTGAPLPPLQTRCPQLLKHGLLPPALVIPFPRQAKVQLTEEQEFKS